MFFCFFSKKLDVILVWKAEDKVHGLLLKHLPRRSDLLSATTFLLYGYGDNSLATD